MTDTASRRGRLATISAVLVAILSSACCWLPLLLLGLGVSGGVLVTFFAPLRPWLLPVSLVLLAVGWYFTLRPLRTAGSTCATAGEDCCAPGSGNRSGRRFNLTMLVIATVMVGVFAFFPDYLGALLPARAVTPAAADDLTTTIAIEGMTCSACEIHVRKQLEKVPGITVDKVDYASGRAVVHATGAVPDSLLQEAVEKAGYRWAGNLSGDSIGYRQGKTLEENGQEIPGDIIDQEMRGQDQ